MAEVLAASVKFGAAVTVTTSGMDFTKPPPEATMETVYFPGGVLIDGVKLRVLTPAPGAGKAAGVNEPVMPIGKLLNPKLTPLLKVPRAATVVTTVTGEACATDTDVLASEIAKLGGTTNVRGRLMVWL